MIDPPLARRGRVPAAVLWDMDGTLVDTEPYWIASEFDLATKYGGRWTREHALALVGYDLIVAGRYIREHMGITLTPEQIVDELLDGVVARVRAEVPWRPGARELLSALRVADIPCALVTMSYQRFVAPILEHLPPGTFQAIVTGDAISQGKPHPEPYLAAAAALGVAPGECVAIEDSTTGVTSAEAAGCTVLVVPNHVSVAEGPARVFRASLSGLDVADLCALCFPLPADPEPSVRRPGDSGNSAR
jgi:HAD superfamily hydrolase (TIGR01509 family)